MMLHTYIYLFWGVYFGDIQYCEEYMFTFDCLCTHIAGYCWQLDGMKLHWNKLQPTPAAGRHNSIEKKWDLHNEESKGW